MTVETATYIDTLDPSLPLSGDPKSEGDNHLRLIKQVLKNTFPNVNAAVTVTDEQLNQLLANMATSNLVLNPHGSIQQETTTPVTATNAYYADQWQAQFTAAGGAFQAGVTTGTVSSYDPSYMFTKTTTAKGALAAGDFNIIQQPIEGNCARRLLMGTSSAKGSWLRWRASSSQSGTASVSIRNGAGNRSFVQSFAVTTTPTDYFLFVPGDTTGTWPTDNTLGAAVAFCHAAGTTFQTSTLGAWQAGNFVAANTQSNMLDTVNRQLNITDVSWKPGSVLLPFTEIDFEQELARCQRYFNLITDLMSGGQTGTAGSGSFTMHPHPVVMRVAPMATYNNISYTNASALGTNVSTDRHLRTGITVAANGTAYATSNVSLSARM